MLIWCHSFLNENYFNNMHLERIQIVATLELASFLTCSEDIHMHALVYKILPDNSPSDTLKNILKLMLM